MAAAGGAGFGAPPPGYTFSSRGRLIKLTEQGAQYREGIKIDKEKVLKKKHALEASIQEQLTAAGISDIDAIEGVRSINELIDSLHQQILDIEHKGNTSGMRMREWIQKRAALEKAFTERLRLISEHLKTRGRSGATDDELAGASADDDALVAALGGLRMNGGYRKSRKHRKSHKGSRKAHRKSRKHRKSRRSQKSQRRSHH